MSDLKLSAPLRLIVDRAESQAKRNGHGSVTPLHLYLALDGME